MQPIRLAYVVLGLALRMAFLGWGAYQDAHATLPYTDVDYFVFNDGAHALWTACPLAETIESPHYKSDSDLLDHPELSKRVHCARGAVPALARFVLYNDTLAKMHAESIAKSSWLLRASAALATHTRPLFRFFATLGDPYARPTYRYTPLLAFVLAPAHAFHVERFVPKLVFALVDVACALLMWAILDERAKRFAGAAPSLAGPLATHLPGILWLVNPFPAQIATRGSADNLVGVLVLSFLLLLIRATPEVGLLGPPREPAELVARRDPSALRVANETAFYSAAVVLALAVHLKLYPVIYGAAVLAHLTSYRRYALLVLCGIRTPRRSEVLHLAVVFAAVAAAAYGAICGAVWLIWGEPYVRHALLYHVTRQDPRHNFSVHFLPTYLMLGAKDDTTLLLRLMSSPLASFVPQLATVAAAGFWLGGHDLVMACAVQTVVFVAWNKVYTSQYFLWYLWFVPVIGVTMRLSRRNVVLLVTLWIAAQACWLAQAYRLEFLGQDTFLALWICSVGLLAVHAFCIQRCLGGWRAWRLSHAKAKTA